jgi:hypothetical protein
MYSIEYGGLLRYLPVVTFVNFRSGLLRSLKVEAAKVQIYSAKQRCHSFIPAHTYIHNVIIELDSVKSIMIVRSINLKNSHTRAR